MIQRKGAFETIGGHVPGVPVPTDIVDQHIDKRKRAQYLAGYPPNIHL
jgi:hypothetical protein